MPINDQPVHAQHKSMAATSATAARFFTLAHRLGTVLNSNCLVPPPASGQLIATECCDSFAFKGSGQLLAASAGCCIPRAMCSRIAGGEEYPICATFEDCGLRQDLLQSVYAYGLEKPSAIQQCGILPILDGRDVYLEAPSGVGKTTALMIGCTASIDCSVKRCQALVLCPTRELAHAIRHVFSSFDRRIESYSLVGGLSVRDDMQALRNGQHLIVGTPGRSHDMIRRGFLDTSSLKLIVLDELQELLRRGFADTRSGFGSTARVCVCVYIGSATANISELRFRGCNEIEAGEGHDREQQFL